jgi:DNA polymerase
MSESGIPSPAELARIARQHIGSLRAAGIDWVPAAPASPAAALSREETPQQHSLGGSTLFDGVSDETPRPVLSLDERKHSLKVLTEQVAGCTRCPGLASTRTQTVFGVGKLDPDVCFVGEAPGADEDARGEPFVGAAGQLLNRIIAACGMKRDEVYICNILKCRPPGNRLPQADEAANCREYLEKQIDLVRPKSICALGACAAQNLLATTASIGRLRGQFQQYRGIPVLCTYHPAYLLRNPGAKKDVWEDMKKLMAKLGRLVK